jgi:hypothetical protein
LLCGATGIIRSPPVEGMAMTIDPSLGEMNWMEGRNNLPGRRAFPPSRISLLLLPVIAIAGILTWAVRSGPSDAKSQPSPRSPVTLSEQNTTSLLDPVVTATATQAPPAMPASASPSAGTVPAEMAPLDKLKLSSQSWRRGGLGSNALVTFTLRNANDFAVKDIEISCAFVRRDGSHLTDRKRPIPATVAMKSRKTFARMHIGFVNVNADKAKCALVSASRV